MHRQTGELTWIDEAVSTKGRNEQLEQLGELIDWSRVTCVVSGVYSSTTGRPSYPPLVMVRALLLAQWYRLSDPQLEQALSDRISFRRFVGLSLEDDTPDHSTLCRFRQQLAEQKLDRALFDEVGRQLEAKGLVLKRGTLMDATLVKAQAIRPGGEKAARSTVDPDADWTGTKTGSHFGYKAHLGVDKGSGIVRRAELTSARVRESEQADTLICGDERSVYGDKAYQQRARSARLRELGIYDRIMRRRHKTQATLSPHLIRRNDRIAKIRWQVERVFGTLKRTYNYTQVRYFSLKANTTQMLLLVTAYNLRRALRLSA